MAHTDTVITIPSNPREIIETPLTPQTKAPTPYTRQKSNVGSDKTLSSAANLVKLLPSGTVLAFQALSASFSKRGECYPSNVTLTVILIALCSLSCLFFSITDSLRGCDGKIYYGVATFEGIYLFNCDKSDLERCRIFKDLSKYRITVLDYVHALFTVVVFLSVAFSTSDVQRCLFPDAGPNAKELASQVQSGAAARIYTTPDTNSATQSFSLSGHGPGQHSFNKEEQHGSDTQQVLHIIQSWLLPSTTGEVIGSKSKGRISATASKAPPVMSIT